ncbi:MAG: hypothetical protein GY906_11690 [bacterium]|nr:hypothetical protein [bacterium]
MAEDHEIRSDCAKQHAILETNQANLTTRVDRLDVDLHRHVEVIAASLDKLAGNGRKGEIEKLAEELRTFVSTTTDQVYLLARESSQQVAAVTTQIKTVDVRTKTESRENRAAHARLWKFMASIAAAILVMAFAVIRSSL